MAEKPQYSKTTKRSYHAIEAMDFKLETGNDLSDVLGEEFSESKIYSKTEKEVLLSPEDTDNETSAEDVPTDMNHKPSNNVQRGVITVNNEHWSNVPTVTKEKKFTVSRPGANITSVDSLETFNLFFTNELIEHILNYTNLYAEKFLQSHDLKNKSRFKKWKLVTPNEIRVYLGFAMYRS